jgi:hypothetical protein
VSTRVRRYIFWGGIVMALGDLLLIWSVDGVFSQLVNYQRLGLILPLCYGVAMMHIDTFACWSTASAYNRIRASGILFFAII